MTMFRLVYISRNALRGDPAALEAEVAQILAVSRRNNARAAVTGALLFNHDCFAQTVEGAMHDVQATFERIQCDPRHRQTVVLQAGPARDRAFGDWSMAYAGRVDATAMRFDALIGSGEEQRRTTSANTILDLLHNVVLRAETV